jgi:hypothetical protein
LLIAEGRQFTLLARTLLRVHGRPGLMLKMESATCVGIGYSARGTAELLTLSYFFQQRPFLQPNAVRTFQELPSNLKASCKGSISSAVIKRTIVAENHHQ